MSEDPSVPVPAPTRSGLGEISAKVGALAIVFAGLLYPKNRIGWVQLLVAVPLVFTAIWHRADRAFRLWALYGGAFVAFVTVRGLANETGIPVQFRYVIAADRVLGLGEVPTLRLQHWLYTPGKPTLLDFLTLFVYLSYFAAPTIVALVLWAVRSRVWPRYVIAAAITWLVSVIIVVAVPTAPPWMAAEEGYLAPVTRMVHRIITIVNPEVYHYGVRVAGHNNVAAMPSLHFAGAWLVALGLASWHWTLRLPGFVYGAWMAFALVYLGEHYLSDVLVGLVIVQLSWYLAGRWTAAEGDEIATSPGSPSFR